MAGDAIGFREVFAQLESWGSESARKIYARQGAGENQFGVLMGKLRGLAKKLKTQHALALELWQSGNADAMVLATMLFDPKQLSKKDVQDLLKPITYNRLVDEFVDNVVIRTAFWDELREKWQASSNRYFGRAGWNLLIHKIKTTPAEVDLEGVLKTLERDLKDAPRRKQDAMNHCLVTIALEVPALRNRCLNIAERLGPLHDDPVPKGCTSSYAPEWVAAVLKRK